MLCSLAQVVKIAISLSVLFTFGLAYYVPITVLWPMIRSRIVTKSARYHRFYESSLRLGGVVGTSKRHYYLLDGMLNVIPGNNSSLSFFPSAALLAIAVPQMVPLLGLLSALGMSTIMLLIPILIETSTKWAEATRTMLVKNIAIFIVWLLILVRLFLQTETHEEIYCRRGFRKSVKFQFFKIGLFQVFEKVYSNLSSL